MSAALLIDSEQAAIFDVEREATMTATGVEELASAKDGKRLVGITGLFGAAVRYTAACGASATHPAKRSKLLPDEPAF